MAFPDTLPDELLHEIFYHLDALSIVPLSKTCSRLRKLLLTPRCLELFFKYKYEIWTVDQRRPNAKTARQAILEADLNLRCLISRKALSYRAFDWSKFSDLASELRSPEILSESEDSEWTIVDKYYGLPEGRIALYLSSDISGRRQQIRVFDLTSGKMKACITPHYGNVEMVMFYSTLLFAVQEPAEDMGDVRVCAYNTDTGEPVETYFFVMLDGEPDHSDWELTVNDDYVIFTTAHFVYLQNRRAVDEQAHCCELALAEIVSLTPAGRLSGARRTHSLCIRDCALTQDRLWIGIEPHRLFSAHDDFELDDEFGEESGSESSEDDVATRHEGDEVELLSNRSGVVAATQEATDENDPDGDGLHGFLISFELKDWTTSGSLERTAIDCYKSTRQIWPHLGSLNLMARRAPNFTLQFLSRSELSDCRWAMAFYPDLGGHSVPDRFFESGALSSTSIYLSNLPATVYAHCESRTDETTSSALDDEELMQPAGLFLMLHRSAIEPPSSRNSHSLSRGSWLDWGRLRGPGEAEEHFWEVDARLDHNENWIVADPHTGHILVWQVGKNAPD